jgi:flagellum-specific peptidoglycan hydrolase FlgJ
MSTQTDFINLIKSGAQEFQKKYGILASLTISQAADESGWGERATRS